MSKHIEIQDLCLDICFICVFETTLNKIKKTVSLVNYETQQIFFAFVSM